MKILFTILATSFSAISFAQQGLYNLYWADEFNGTTLDTQSWSVEKGGGSNWNNTAIDDPSVIEISNGTLKLKGIKNPGFNGSLSTAATIDKTNVWTGAIDTQYKVDFKYGKIEVRARIESAYRAWPAIWLMPTHSVYGGNPDSGEIDIVEHLNKSSFYYSTIHTEYHSTYKSDPERYTTETCDVGDWQVYAIEWDANKIVFLRNGVPYHTFNRGNSATVNGLLRWPFDQDFYIILSQQIGGGWVDGEASGPLTDADMPLIMEIDYVRVYEEVPLTTEEMDIKKDFFAYKTSEGIINLSEETSWMIYDLSGRLLKDGSGDEIRLPEYASGCYLIKTKYGTTKMIL